MLKKSLPIALWILVLAAATAIAWLVSRRPVLTRTGEDIAASAPQVTRPRPTPHDTVDGTPSQPSATTSVPHSTPSGASASPSRTPRPQVAGQTPTVAGALPFQVGERLRYIARWSQLNAAEATVEVRNGPTPDVLKLTCTAATTSLARALYALDFSIDANAARADLRPRSGSRRIEQDGSVMTYRTEFDHARGVMYVDDLMLPLDVDAQDSLTALFALRTLRLGAVGSRQTMEINDLGTAVDLLIEVTGRADGQVDLMLRPTLRDGSDALQIGARMEEYGARRLLELRAELPFGSIVVELAD